MTKTIFVFGSNLAGKHFGGAARTAREKYGAEISVGEGRTGRSYALPTMDECFNPLPLARIAQSVTTFKAHVFVNADENFYVTRVGCGIAGFKDEQIAPLFIGFPSNCTFDPQWSSYGLPAWKEVL